MGSQLLARAERAAKAHPDVHTFEPPNTSNGETADHIRWREARDGRMDFNSICERPLSQTEFDRLCVEIEALHERFPGQAVREASTVASFMREYIEPPFAEPVLRKVYLERLVMELSLQARVAHYEEDEQRALDPDKCENAKDLRKTAEYHSMRADRALQAEDLPAHQQTAFRAEWGLPPKGFGVSDGTAPKHQDLAPEAPTRRAPGF